MKKKLFRFVMCSITVFSIICGMICPMSIHAVTTTAASAAPAVITAATAEFPYENIALSFEERAADLVSRMTQAEKIAQLGRTAPAIPRLDIKNYDYWSEALHGVARQGAATSFPTSLSLASSWDTELMLQIASVISTEARGKTDETGRGLSYWSPTINMARDPRWGRNEETYGEDPVLSAAIGGMFVKGMQGDDSKYLKTVSTIKHFAANNSEFNRHNGNSVMDDRTLREYYTAAFQSITEKQDVQSVMSSYNRVNGVPASANTYLLDTLLRKTWGFDGYVVSDCGAIDDIRNNHRWIPEGYTQRVTHAQATALSIQAGTDLDCGSIYQGNALAAVNGNILTEDEIDLALLRLFTARMKTGEFDPAEIVPYAQIKKEVLEAPEHLALSLQSSRQAPVLLKNADNNLPLDINKVGSIVVIGELATFCELGDYSGTPTTKVSFKDGLAAYLNEKNYKGTLEFYNGVTAQRQSNLPSYVMNIGWFEFDGRRTQAISATELSGMRKETSNLGYVENKSYAVFQNIDITNLKDISVNASSPESQPGIVEFRVGSLTGPLLGTVNTTTTGDWGTYRAFTAKAADGIELTGSQTVYMIVRFNVPDDAEADREKAMEAAKKADAVIAFVGTGWSSDVPGEYRAAAEERDRADLSMPVGQDALVKEIGQNNPNTIVVMSSVGFHDVNPYVNEVKSILFSSYNGQFQGTAMAEILFGDVNPSGRLPFTWYADVKDIPDIGDYTIRAVGDSLGRTYQYFKGSVQYPFGYGLSYTNFGLSDFALSKQTAAADETITVSGKVTNTGTCKGAEIVQVYVKSPKSGDPLYPVKQLKGFARAELDPGKDIVINIPLDVKDLSFIDETTGKRVVFEGAYEIQVGISSENILWTGTLNIEKSKDPVLKNVTLRGDKVTAKPGETFDSQLTIAMSDESFIEAGAASIVYKSSNPAIASVDAITGEVTAIDGGTTQITATVTVNGNTLSDTYPVAVKTVTVARIAEAEGIFIEPDVLEVSLSMRLVSSENILSSRFHLYEQTADGYIRIATSHFPVIYAENVSADKNYFVTCVINQAGDESERTPVTINTEAPYFENVFLNKPVTSVKAALSGYGTANLVDGNISTRYAVSDGSGNHGVTINLQDEYPLTQMRIYEFSNPTRSGRTKFEVYTEADGWKTIFEDKALSGGTMVIDFDKPNPMASMVRFTFVNTSGTACATFYDIQCTSVPDSRTNKLALFNAIHEAEALEAKAGFKDITDDEALKAYQMAKDAAVAGLQSLSISETRKTVLTNALSEQTAALTANLPLEKLTIIPATIVGTYAANILVEAADDTLDGAELYLVAGVDKIGAGKIQSGKGMLKVTKAPNEAGNYPIIAVLADSVVAEGFIHIEPISDNIWIANLLGTGDELRKISFNATVAPAPKGYDVSMNNLAIGFTQTDDTSVSIDATPKSGDILKIGGVKFTDLFPSYSFTFTIVCE